MPSVTVSATPASEFPQKNIFSATAGSPGGVLFLRLFNNSDVFVVYPTTIDTDMGKEMKEVILKDFDNWNKGYDAWCTWADEIYTEDLMYDYRGTEYDLAGLKEGMKDLIEKSRRVRINNILVSEDWAAIHFYNSTTMEDGSKDADNHMQFIHFVEGDNGLKIDRIWAK